MTLELQDVSKQVGGATHIHRTSLTLAQSGFNVLLGATGAGKTTLMKLMAGLEQPTSGRILMDGADVTGVSPQRRNVSFVHQFFINYPNMTVWENIASPLRIQRLARAEIERRVEETARLLRLTPMLKRRPSELSGGQQQRTALARAIVKDARLVLLDEPLANLDYKLREEMREELPKLFQGRGTVVVYATSEPHEALLLGGHVATMHEGRVTQFGPTADAYRRPRTIETARVFSDPPINIGEVVKEAGVVRLDGHASWPAQGAAAAMPDGRYRLAVRPHHVAPKRTAGAAVPLEGSVLLTELSGSESVAHFRFGDQTWVSQSHGVHPYQLGASHTFWLDPAGHLYFDPDGNLVAA
jgi:glycerol transport system ATP-binding protein